MLTALGLLIECKTRPLKHAAKLYWMIQLSNAHIDLMEAVLDALVSLAVHCLTINEPVWIKMSHRSDWS